MNNAKFAVIIPARGGSKGLPGKNIIELNATPMICYTLTAAQDLFDNSIIYVSTDSNEIKRVVEQCGVKINRLRPSDLATDTASIIDVLFDVLNNDIQDLPDYIILMQPTSPFRNSSHLSEALRLVSQDVDMVVSVCESHANPYWNLFEENSAGFLVKSKEGDYTRRQDLPSVYTYNGAIYIIKTQSLIDKKSLKFEKIVKYVMDKQSSVDIDDILDFKFAQLLMGKNGQN